MISATMFRDSTKQELTEEQEQLKREIYERMNPRRRKFIDRIRASAPRSSCSAGSCIRSANAPRAMTSTKALSTARSGL